MGFKLRFDSSKGECVYSTKKKNPKQCLNDNNKLERRVLMCFHCSACSSLLAPSGSWWSVIRLLYNQHSVIRLLRPECVRHEEIDGQ